MNIVIFKRFSKDFMQIYSNRQISSIPTDDHRLKIRWESMGIGENKSVGVTSESVVTDATVFFFLI